MSTYEINKDWKLVGKFSIYSVYLYEIQGMYETRWLIKDQREVPDQYVIKYQTFAEGVQHLVAKYDFQLLSVAAFKVINKGN